MFASPVWVTLRADPDPELVTTILSVLLVIVFRITSSPKTVKLLIVTRPDEKISP